MSGPSYARAFFTGLVVYSGLETSEFPQEHCTKKGSKSSIYLIYLYSDVGQDLRLKAPCTTQFRALSRTAKRIGGQ